MENNDLPLPRFLISWLANLTFEQRTCLLIGACRMRASINSGIENKVFTNTTALDRLIRNLDSTRYLNPVDIDIEHVKYPTEPIVTVLSTGNPDLSSDEDDLSPRNVDPYKGVNNTIPRFVEKDIETVTTVLDLTPDKPTKSKESRLRRWRRKTAKNIKRLFTCCVQTDEVCVV